MKTIKAGILYNFKTGKNEVVVYDKTIKEWILNTGQFPGVSTDPGVIRNCILDHDSFNVHLVFVDEDLT